MKLPGGPASAATRSGSTPASGWSRARRRPAGSRQYAHYDEDAVELIQKIKVAQSIGFSLSELIPIAAAYVAGQLDDEEQRLLLETKLAEIQERRRKLDQMCEFLRSKLNDLPARD